MEVKKKLVIMGIVIAVLGIGLYTMKFAKKEAKEESRTNSSSDSSETSERIDIALSLEDSIGENTVWCGTFNLIWNDLKNDLAKQDIVFTPQLEVVQNLNKGTFNTSYLSDESYYKKYGMPNWELKAEIEKAIKDKFGETSDILDGFDWTNHTPKDYFLYVMLKKDFEFPNVFTELENGEFGKYENVNYFGIDGNTEKQVRNQVEVLYYNSKEDFAIKLHTKGNDEVIIVRGCEQDTFGKMYEEIQKKKMDYQGDASFGEEDILKIPNIKFKLMEEFPELADKPFLFSTGESYQIEKAVQTIQFELDKKGGKIKSEAGMMVDTLSLKTEKPREFLVEDAFSLFLVEKEKDLPYFAAKISDITKVQEGAKKGEGKQNEGKEEMYFYGKVVESNENYIIVEPREDEEVRKSADRISIGLGENVDYRYEIGTNVKITYNGVVLETYPAQVAAKDIEVKSAENFEIQFMDKKHESREKVRLILEKTDHKIYDYNIYSYMGEVNIKIEGEEMPLRDALLAGKITMDEILQKANQDLNEKKIEGDIYQDGGSMIYHYEDYTMIKVHNLNGNRDVYFGVPEMTLNDLAV